MTSPPKQWHTTSVSADDDMKQTWYVFIRCLCLVFIYFCPTFRELLNPSPVSSAPNTSGVVSDGNDSSKNRPPPLPPRPHEGGYSSIGYNPGMSSYGSYGGMGSPYGMGMGSYGGYGSGYGGLGGYGAFGGYGGGYGGYGRAAMYSHNSSDESNDFIRMAEESSRQAFQSIESIVHAFGSVSMMLESTYFAVHSSFRAVLGVADHFSKLRGHMTHVISSLAIIKTVNWFVRRLAFVLGVTSIDPSDERVWSEAERSASLSPEALAEALTRSQRKSSWPILIFFAVVFGTPWLIWKLLLRISEPTADSPSKHWVRGVGPHYRATGRFDFQTDRPGEVAFSAGQELRIAPKQLQPSVRGWLLASDGSNVGLVPSSYVTIIELRSGAEQRDEHPQADP